MVCSRGWPSVIRNAVVYPREARRVLINLVRSRPPVVEEGSVGHRSDGDDDGDDDGEKKELEGERKEWTALAAHEGRENRSFPSFALLHRAYLASLFLS